MCNVRYISTCQNSHYFFLNLENSFTIKISTPCMLIISLILNGMPFLLIPLAINPFLFQWAVLLYSLTHHNHLQARTLNCHKSLIFYCLVCPCQQPHLSKMYFRLYLFTTVLREFIHKSWASVNYLKISGRSSMDAIFA